MPVAPLACHTVARTEVNFVRYVAWVGRGQEMRAVNVGERERSQCGGGAGCVKCESR